MLRVRVAAFGEKRHVGIRRGGRVRDGAGDGVVRPLLRPHREADRIASLERRRAARQVFACRRPRDARDSVRVRRIVKDDLLSLDDLEAVNRVGDRRQIGRNVRPVRIVRRAEKAVGELPVLQLAVHVAHGVCRHGDRPVLRLAHAKREPVHAIRRHIRGCKCHGRACHHADTRQNLYFYPHGRLLSDVARILSESAPRRITRWGMFAQFRCLYGRLARCGRPLGGARRLAEPPREGRAPARPPSTHRHHTRSRPQ